MSEVWHEYVDGIVRKSARGEFVRVNADDSLRILLAEATAKLEEETE